LRRARVGQVDADRQLKQPGDVEIALDLCKLRVGGRMWDIDRQVWRRALAFRDSMLRSLATATRGRAFIIVGAPSQAERTAWCRALGIAADHVIVLATRPRLASRDCTRTRLAPMRSQH
jgi:hypothetical protein